MASDVDPELLEKNPDRIRNMFADIASRYDLANSLLTGTTDALWRNRTAFELTRELRRRVKNDQLSLPLDLLDACAGTGKLGQRILQHLNRPATGYAVDFCVPLLKEGTSTSGPDASLHAFGGDLLHMPVPDNSFDAVSIGFGYRNLVNRKKGLREIRRILRPNGLLAILEFHVPRHSIFRTLYLLYFDHVLPLLGTWISGTSSAAYRYLNESVRAFPNSRELQEEFRENGFGVRLHRPMMMGAVHLYLLERKT